MSQQTSERPVRVGVVMDSIAHLTYKKDTTLAMLWAAQARGWSLHYMEQEDLYLRDGRAHARMRDLTAFRNPDDWYALGAPESRPLAELDVILMRKDPPVDAHFLNAVHLLGFAEREGVLVVNPTRALLECNEKLFAQQFPQCCTPTVVSCNEAVLRAFHAEHQDVIFKPLDGMGGSGIFHVRPEGATWARSSRCSPNVAGARSWPSATSPRSRTVTPASCWWTVSRCLSAWPECRWLARPAATWPPGAPASAAS